MRIEDIDREFQQLAELLKTGDEAFQRGDMQQAEIAYEKSYGLIKDFGEHPDAEACMSRLAEVYYARHRYGEACELLLEVYRIRVEQVGTQHSSLVPLLFRTARCYERQGLLLQAEYEYVQCLGLMNVIGMPDRAAAASIVESFARMLRSIEGRSEEAEQMEGQARDLRNFTREKLNLEILKHLSFDGIEVVELTDESAPRGRSGIASLRQRAGADALEPKQGGQKVIALAVVGVLLAGAAAAAIAWRFMGVETAKKKRLAMTAALPGVVKPRSQMFKTIDGIEQLILFNNGDATFLSGGETEKGKFVDSQSSLQFKLPGQAKPAHVFPKDPEGYLDENGVVLYGEGAKEWMVVSAMRTIASQAQASYHANGSYLGSVPTYLNPFSGKYDAPGINNIGSMDRNVNFDKLQQFEDQVNKVLTWTQWSTGRAGYIELYHYASGDAGDTLYIKGTDGAGRYLRSSAPQSAFLIQLVNGDPK